MVKRGHWRWCCSSSVNSDDLAHFRTGIAFVSGLRRHDGTSARGAEAHYSPADGAHIASSLGCHRSTHCLRDARDREHDWISRCAAGSGRCVGISHLGIGWCDGCEGQALGKLAHLDRLLNLSGGLVVCISSLICVDYACPGRRKCHRAIGYRADCCTTRVHHQGDIFSRCTPGRSCGVGISNAGSARRRRRKGDGLCVFGNT